MDKPTWIIHYVPNDFERSPTGTNIHTHGLEEYGGELQVVLPLSFGVAAAIINEWGDAMRKGELVIEEGKDYQILGNGLHVRFIPAMEGERRVWRAILPDQLGNLDPETMGKYAIQYEQTGINDTMAKERR